VLHVPRPRASPGPCKVAAVRKTQWIKIKAFILIVAATLTLSSASQTRGAWRATMPYKPGGAYARVLCLLNDLAHVPVLDDLLCLGFYLVSTLSFLIQPETTRRLDIPALDSGPLRPGHFSLWRDTTRALLGIRDVFNSGSCQY
jgi:hypothetical protein